MKDIVGLGNYADAHRTTFPRKRIDIYFDCFAPDFLFEVEFDDLSEEAKEFYDKYHLPCEGTGNLSCFCSDCPFAEEDWEDVS